MKITNLEITGTFLFFFFPSFSVINISPFFFQTLPRKYYFLSAFTVVLFSIIDILNQILLFKRSTK